MKKTKTQILFINGGMTFKTKKDYINYLKTREIYLREKIKWWKDYFNKELGKNFEIIRPRMPCQDNAKYSEWKIHFERYFPYLKDNIILIGQSLGGMFLAKYLSENNFPKKILSIYLICPPFDDSIPREDLAGGFKLKSDLSRIETNSKKLTLMFSKDDNVVPISHAKKYKDKLKNAKIIIYKSKNGHFQVSRFPEIIKMIKEDVKAE
jgi:predicted alpha/beta hydrolase family esterase